MASRKAWTKRTALRSRMGEPDPMCKTGVISLDQKVCCAGYCSECTDYPTCESVRGQDSKNACCASEVLNMACSEGAPANKCLKSCKDSVPPCILEEADFEIDKSLPTAADDCNEAIQDWRKKADNAIEQAEKDADK